MAFNVDATATTTGAATCRDRARTVRGRDYADGEPTAAPTASTSARSAHSCRLFTDVEVEGVRARPTTHYNAPASTTPS